MPAAIIIENSYSNEDAIEKLITYILDPQKAPSYGVCGNWVNLLNSHSIINDFKLIQSIYEKTDGRKIRHIIVSFAKYEGITEEDMAVLEFHAVDFFRSLGHQAIAAIHRPMSQGGLLHFHIAINTVNLYDGSKYTGNYTQNNEFFNYIKSIEPYNCLRWILEPKYRTEYLEVELG